MEAGLHSIVVSGMWPCDLKTSTEVDIFPQGYRGVCGYARVLCIQDDQTEGQMKDTEASDCFGAEGVETKRGLREVRPTYGF